MPVGSISGIASSLDTDAIVEAILAYESRNSLLIQARKQQKTNELTAWNSISAYLLGFKAKAYILSRESAWNVKSAANSDVSVFTANVTAQAVAGVYYISVHSLATQHQLASQGFTGESVNIGTGTVVITVGDNATETITIDSENNNIEGLRDAINDADAGLTASIINDGSSNNPYRLLLTSGDTGLENAISISINLSGGTAPDFSTSSFDNPETLVWNTNADSTPSLGDTASYTGSENKIYTFTIQGSGAMTVGSGDIFIDWTDGTNSGTITVSSADTEVALSGNGADGLKVKFSAGTLYGGDTFQVQTFSPVVQEAGDAQISIGNTSGGGSPILINSSSNTISDVIEGVTLNLLKVSDSGPNTLTVEINKNGITQNVRGLINDYNQLMDYIDSMMAYNPETEVAGILIGSTSLMNLQSYVRRIMVNPIDGMGSDIDRLLDIGVSTGTDGRLSLDTSVLHEKLEDDLQAVIDLFRTSGSSDNSGVEFLYASDDTVMTASGYSVNITQTAAKGSFSGTSISDPSISNLIINDTNYKFKIRVNGVLSDEIELTRKTYTSGDELAEEIEAQINAEGTLGSNNVSVAWIDNGDSGHFEIESTIYGSNSKVVVLSSSSNTAVTILGLDDGTSTDGVNVEGTINGESATGIGQILTGNSDNDTTAGLSLRVTLTENELQEDSDEAVIAIARGIASLLSFEINKYTDSYDGTIVSRVNGLQKQIEIYDEQLENLYTRLEKRRKQLYQEFYVMEQTLARLQTQQEYFTYQLSQLSS